jgi:hypothetical protein
MYIYETLCNLPRVLWNADVKYEKMTTIFTVRSLAVDLMRRFLSSVILMSRRVPMLKWVN